MENILKNTGIKLHIKSIAILLLFGGMLTACGGDTQSAATTRSQLLANGEACNPVWLSASIYTGGAAVSYNGVNYKAAYWTQGNNPSTSSGPSGSGQPWITGFSCGGSVSTTTTKATTSTTKATTVIGTTTTSKASTTTTKATTTTSKANSTTTTTTSSGAIPTKAQAEAYEASLTNNAFFRTVKASVRTLPNAIVEAVTPGNPSNPINVKRIERLISSAKWDFYFAVRDPSYSYQRFLQAVAKFPAFCDDYTDGRNADNICRHSLATMFAHFGQETGDHNDSLSVPQWRQGLKNLRELGCSETGTNCGYNGNCNDPTFNKIWTCGKNTDGSFKKYFGRGATQLTYNFNYGTFSQAMNNGNQFVLLNNPDLVASTWLNLSSATFFFVFPQPPKPSMLHVLDGTWVPNAVDKATGVGNNFASTIMIINDGECGSGTETAAAQYRINYFKQFAADLGWNYSTEALSCAKMKPFNDGSSASYKIYWDTDWTDGSPNRCELVGYQTPYNALLEGNYVKCVQDNWKITLK